MINVQSCGASFTHLSKAILNITGNITITATNCITLSQSLNVTIVGNGYFMQCSGCSSFTAIYGMNQDSFKFDWNKLTCYTIVTESTGIIISGLNIADVNIGISLDSSMQSISITSCSFYDIAEGILLSSGSFTTSIVISSNYFLRCPLPISLVLYASAVIEDNVIDTVTGTFGISVISGTFTKVILINTFIHFEITFILRWPAIVCIE